MGYRYRLFFALGAALLAACSSAEEQAVEARDKARAALVRGERDAALDALSTWANRPGDAPASVIATADLLVWAGEAPRAVWLLEAAVRHHPGHHDLRIALGNAALLVSNATLASATTKEVPPESEHHLAALVIQAQAEAGLGNLEEALALYQKAEELYPETPEARLGRIAALLRERRYEEAQAALDEAREVFETDEGRARLRRFEIALHSTRLEALGKQRKARSPVDEAAAREALAALEQLVAEQPDDLLALQALTRALSQEGRREEAAARVRAAMEADSKAAALAPLLAALEAGGGDLEAAEATLRSGTERAPSPSTYIALARFYAGPLENPARARQVYRDGIAAFPDEVVLRHYYAEVLLADGLTDEAEAQIERFRELAPDDPVGRYLLARLALARGDAPGAVRRLEALIPYLDQAATRYWLGRALEETGDTAGAWREYRVALTRRSTDTAALTALAELARAAGDMRGVVAANQALVRSIPDRYAHWDALCIALERLGEGEASENVARKAMQAFPNLPEPHLRLMAALRSQGRYDDALKAADAAQGRFGPSADLAAERALVLGAQGRVDQGAAVALAATVEHPDSPSAQVALAALLFELGRSSEGAQAVDRALELAPDEPNPLKLRAGYRAATGEPVGALDDCDRFLAVRPADAGVHFTRGAVLHGLGRRDEAISAYRRAAELDPQAFAPRNNLAYLLAESGDVDGALQAAQEAYSLAESNAYVMDTLGWLYLRKGLVDRSISILEDAHAAEPGLPDAQLHLALAYREAGRDEQALALLRDLDARRAGGDPLRAEVREALRSLE